MAFELTCQTKIIPNAQLGEMNLGADLVNKGHLVEWIGGQNADIMAKGKAVPCLPAIRTQEKRVNRFEFRQLAEDRIADARILLAAGLWAQTLYDAIATDPDGVLPWIPMRW